MTLGLFFEVLSYPMFPYILKILTALFKKIAL